jgi:hypothetical protein
MLKKGTPAGASVDKNAVCAWCGEPMGGSRIADGEDLYHDACYWIMLQKGRRIHGG